MNQDCYHRKQHNILWMDIPHVQHNMHFIMKKILISTFRIVFSLILTSCGNEWDGVSFYNDYQIHNNLDTTILIQLISSDKQQYDTTYYIDKNTTKSILFSSVGGGEGIAPYNYKRISVYYKNQVFTDSLDNGNSIMNIRLYKISKGSDYKGMPLNVYIFKLDSIYINDHL